MIMYENYQYGNYRQGCGTRKASGGDYGGGSENIVLEKSISADLYNLRITGSQSVALTANSGSSATHSGPSILDTEGLTVRRLTPLECERLQGFPDNWTDIGDWIDTKGKVHKESADSARYKALGNSIAIPPWFYVLQKLSLCCGADNTMASLFDGIGGFPYVWESLNGRGSCVWASEIEEFPVAVTKYHFPEDVENEQ